MLVHSDVVAVALDKAEGSTFERFVNEFLPAITGADYVPMGGMHDGGADAFGGDTVYERVGSATTFYQASVQQDFRAKIRDTIKRLRGFGRDPRRVTYVTSRSIQYIDMEEENLSEATGVTVRIHDAKYITSHINADTRTRAAFEHHLRHLTDYLKQIGSSSMVHASSHVRAPAVFVFLRQELDRRSGDLSLVEAVIDSLALWALEGTDPDADIFMSASDVENKILQTIPSARALIHNRVVRRLQALGVKSYPGGRQVRWHRKESLYCLPYETRLRIEGENLEDEALRLHVLNGLYTRAVRDNPDGDESTLRRSSEVTLRALQIVFEREGLEFANFITGGSDVEPPTIGDAVRDALEECGVFGGEAVKMGSISLASARGCLYQSTEQERAYLGKLARTYALLFTLNNEPRLVQYFQEMAADFYIYVGTDLIVRALSEHYLAVPDQLAKNTLLMAARAGARLVLTEPVLGEVLHHLRATDLEHRNYFEGVEHRVTEEIASAAPKILLRTYLYTRMAMRSSGAKGPKNWPAFVNQFCGHSTLHRNEAREDLRRYLQHAFAMEYRTKEELWKLVDAEKVAEITDVLEQKKDRRLAENDALLACAVYGHRRKNREESRVTEFGYHTWWLTSETMILRHTAGLLRDNGGQKYMMRPDFLLNFLAFAPAAADARRTFSNIFPSTLGIRLSRRMDEDSFRKIMSDVKDAEELDDSRRLAVMARLADQLKTDFVKRYRLQLDDDGHRAATSS